MEFEEEAHGEAADLQNLEDMLDDLGLSDDSSTLEVSKKDSTVFLIDCSQQIMQCFEGDEKSQLQLILDGYYNFLQRKIIASASDKVGLILFNVRNTLSSIGEDHIYKVHSLEKEVDAHRIKEASFLFKEFTARFGGLSERKVPLSSALWEYGAEINILSSAHFHLRVFLFTADDCPHAVGDEHRQISIKRARELAAKNVQIELFPLRKAKKCNFDVRKFYQQIITFDTDEINSTVLDSSSKILDLQERLRQKEFKKRTLNRLVMKIGKDSEEKQVLIAVKIFTLFTKAKKPPAKKVEAKSNKLLQRITRKLNAQGEVLFDGVIGTYYPLGGQKIKISKEDMNKIKNIESPGITLVGFKPKHLIKPYYNLRTSYFIYPDEEHITGSSQFCDALIAELVEKSLVGIVKIVPRNNQQLRFAALFPQDEQYDEEDHFQTPPGFHMIILPYADDIVNFIGDKTIAKPTEVSSELVQITKLLINNLTIHDFDFRDFENPSLQKFYSHLQAHALNEKDVILRPDLLEPDIQGFENFKDIIEMVGETARMDAAMESRHVDEPIDEPPPKAKPAHKSKVKQEVKQEENDHLEVIMNVEELLINGRMKELKVGLLRRYLQINGLDEQGRKEELIDRILVFIEQKNSI